MGALDSSWTAPRPGQARAEDSSPVGPRGAERRRVQGTGEGGGQWEGSGRAGGWRAGSGETPGLDVARELDSTACGVAKRPGRSDPHWRLWGGEGDGHG